MCRLLFYIPNNNPQKTLTTFLNQAKQVKNTPDLENILDTDFHLDGCGFAWLNENKWYCQKFVQIPQSINLPESSLYVGHLRSQGDSIASPALQNCHPFVHDKYIFCHNGKIFDYAFPILLEYIDPQLVPNIQGQTDSESIFYLLLSFIKSGATLVEAIQKFHAQMNILKKHYIGNFIFSDQKQVVITRLSNSDQHQPCSLYYDGLLISSEPLSNNYNLFPEQHYALINVPARSLQILPLMAPKLPLDLGQFSLSDLNTFVPP
jgi:predicted glutamine amidotransferase